MPPPRRNSRLGFVVVFKTKTNSTYCLPKCMVLCVWKKRYDITEQGGKARHRPPVWYNYQADVNTWRSHLREGVGNWHVRRSAAELAGSVIGFIMFSLKCMSAIAIKFGSQQDIVRDTDRVFYTIVTNIIPRFEIFLSCVIAYKDTMRWMGQDGDYAYICNVELVVHYFFPLG